MVRRTDKEIQDLEVAKFLQKRCKKVLTNGERDAILHKHSRERKAIVGTVKQIF